ncbi:hypothetical protein SK128_025833 [Halocaridina rubra]|uniref:Chitin-binding type-2 domain-containing protein n=1 Tax=Halocaridina rubra TaxID=373956 RepID=A0AAN8WWZ4_HALRR
MCSLFQSITATAAYGLCKPSCPGIFRTHDPHFCSRYYGCLTGAPSNNPSFCNAGLLYDKTGQICTTGITCTAECPEGCHLTCQYSGDTIADPYDCRVYYTCSTVGPGAAEICPDNIPNFDHIRKMCTSDPTVCCQSTTCDPYCDPGFSGLVPDPADCTKFYECINGNIYEASMSCNQGEVFNAGLAVCSTSGFCRTWCNGDSLCVEEFLCEGVGFFPMCSVCDPRYYSCSEIGAQGVLYYCPSDYVFDINPDNPYCVPPNECLDNFNETSQDLTGVPSKISTKAKLTLDNPLQPMFL